MLLSDRKNFENRYLWNSASPRSRIWFYGCGKLSGINWWNPLRPSPAGGRAMPLETSHQSRLELAPAKDSRSIVMRPELLSVNFLLIYGLFSILPARSSAPGLFRTRNPYTPTWKTPNEKTGKSYLAYCLELAPSLSCARAFSLTNHAACKVSKLSPACAHDFVCLRARSHFSCQSVLSFFPFLRPASLDRKGEFWHGAKLRREKKRKGKNQ